MGSHFLLRGSSQTRDHTRSPAPSSDSLPSEPPAKALVFIRNRSNKSLFTHTVAYHADIKNNEIALHEMLSKIKWKIQGDVVQINGCTQNSELAVLTEQPR